MGAAGSPHAATGSTAQGSRRVPWAVRSGGSRDQPLISVQALIQSSKPLHLTSFRPSTQSVVGVCQYQTSFQNASSLAWNVSHRVLSTVSAHAFELPGASPNHSAILALISGETR